jgi:hypothetical protein
MNVKTEICNLSQSILGNFSSVNDIDNPTTPAEKAYAKWYDTCRQNVLKLLMPNFALGRKIIAKQVAVPEFGYSYLYLKPIDCLKVLGIGDVQEKMNDYAVEGDNIMTDNDYPDGMKLRYIKDITDVSKFSPEAINLIAWSLAYAVCIEITKDYEKLTYLEKIMPGKLSSASALNAQENLPIRINNSKFKAARIQIRPVNYNKK